MTNNSLKIYVPCFKGEPIFRWASFDKEKVWEKLSNNNALGIDKDIYPTNEDLKKDGCAVETFDVVHEVKFKNMLTVD